MTPFKTLVIITLLLLSGNALAQSEQGPIEIVRETTNELFQMVEQNREKYENDIQALREDIRPILLGEVDTLYSGRLVLGRSARGMESEKVEEFSDALSNLLIRRYADGLLDFRTRDQMEIRPLAGNNTERMTRVRTRVTLDNDEEAPVDYVFRKTDEGWKIFDVIVEGISYVTTFRNQIGEQIRQEGFDTTLEKLKGGDLEIEVDDE
jgi:phospholipid transport system substrate-binding protein